MTELIPGKLYKVTQDFFYGQPRGSTIMFIEESTALWEVNGGTKIVSYLFLLPNGQKATYTDSMANRPLQVLSSYLEKVKTTR